MNLSLYYILCICTHINVNDGFMCSDITHGNKLKVKIVSEGTRKKKVEGRVTFIFHFKNFIL